MNNFSKSILIIPALAMTLTTTGQKKVELRIDPITGDLRYPNTPEVGLFGGVKWVIKDPKIKSFQIVEKSDHNDYIFTNSLPTIQDTILHMKLKPYFRFKESEWEYGIIWTDTTGKSRPYDPKIAVKPILGLAELVFFLGFIVTLITSIMFFRRWQKAEVSLAEMARKISK